MQNKQSLFLRSQIPKNWQKVKLGEIAVVNMGQSPKSEFYNLQGEGLPFYQGVTDFGEKYPSASMYCSQPIRIAEPGTALFSVRAPVGEVNIVNEESCIGRGVASISMKNGNNAFLYPLLKSKTQYFKAVSGGTTYESINKDQIEDMEFEVPIDPENQKQISSILSSFDDKIEVNNKIAKTLEEMAQAIFKEWFVHFKFPGYKKVEFVDSKLGKIPKGWLVKKIKDIATIIKGISYSSEEIKDNSVGLPMINLANFKRGGGFNPDGIKFYTGRYKTTDLVKPGDIVIAMTDLTSNREVIGHPARIPSYSHWDKMLISLDVCAVGTEELYIEFLYYLMIRKEFSYLMASSAGGTNVAHLSKSVIEGYSFILPERNLILEFQDFIKPIFNQINKAELENQKLAALRDLLLPKLMKGEVRV